MMRLTILYFAYGEQLLNGFGMTPMMRTLHKTDLGQILAIEESVHQVPWTEDTFQTCFQSAFIGWVIEEDRRIIGFIILSLRPEDCHVLNLCIAREHQHHGYGQQLLEQALRYAKAKGAGIAYLEVRRSNDTAISLYRKLRFHLIGERKAYYPTPDGHEDALIFAKSLHEEV